MQADKLRELLVAQAEIAQKASDEGWYEMRSSPVLAADAKLMREAAAYLLAVAEASDRLMTDAMRWRALMRDCGKTPVSDYPCLCDDMADWSRDHDIDYDAAIDAALSGAVTQGESSV